MKNNLKNIFVWSYKEEYSVLRKKILKSVDKVFKSGNLILGEEVENLEKKFSKTTSNKLVLELIVERMLFKFVLWLLALKEEMK